MSNNNRNVKKDNRNKASSKISNRNASHNKKDFSKAIQYLQYMLMAIIMFVVFYPPFLRGLYFRNELYPTEIIVFCAYLIFQVIKLFKRDKQFIRTPLDYISMVFVVVYAISLLNAASTHLAIEEWLKYCMYFAVFTMVTEMAKEIKNSFYIMWTIVASAVIVSLIGIDAAANNIIMDILNGILKSLNINYELFDTIQGSRISSTLQYANSLAAYLMAVFFVIMILILLSKKTLSRVVAAISGFLVMTAFLLTQSRGAYIVLPLALIIFAVTLPKKRIIAAVAYITGVAVPVIIATFFIIRYIPEPQMNASKIWLVILVGSIVSAGLIIIIEKITGWLGRLNWKVYAFISGLIALIVIAGAFYLISATEPLKLIHNESQADSSINANKSIALESNKSYKLKYEVESSAGSDKPYAYLINLYSRNEREIMFYEQSLIASSTEKGTNGIETREISFTTPSDVKAISIDFVNFYKGTSAIFHKAYIVDATNGKTVKDLVMNYKYLPEIITSRLEGTMFDKSSLQRSFYIKDGIKIFKDNWLIGAGGGAWERLYTGYQSFTYNSTQAHNYYLQVVLETGVLGILVLLGFGLVLIIMFIRSKKRIVNDENIEWHIMQSALFAGIAALLMHSAMDFDLALSAVALLLWEMAAIFNANYMLMTVEKESIFKVRVIKGKPVIAIVVTLALVLFPSMFSLALHYGAKGSNAANSKDITTGLYYILKAEGLDPWMPQYKIDSANLIYAIKNSSPADKVIADKMMTEAEKLCKYESKLLPGIGSFYLMTGKVENGLALFDRYVELVPFSPETWEQRVNTYYSVMLKYAEVGKQDKVDEYVTRIIDIKGEAEKANTKNLNPFIFTARTMEIFERVQYVKDFMQVKENINLDKVVLYESGSMDINSDDKPDGLIHTKDYMQSRKISLLPDKKYKIQVELKNKSILPSIPFTINGVTEDRKATLNLSGNVYYAEIIVPHAFIPGNNVLTFFMQDMDVDAISKLIIEEE